MVASKKMINVRLSHSQGALGIQRKGSEFSLGMEGGCSQTSAF